MKNAEYEVIQRIVGAGKNIGADVFVADNDGFPLWASHRTVSETAPRLSNKDCDFILSLHFESPKLIDVYSYITLWNPPPFYEVFNYEAATRKLATHDNALSCDSAIADAHAANLFRGLGRPLDFPLPKMFHNLPAPYLEPNINESARLFYVGINWERISGQRGRHQELLEELDAADLIDIYGPKEFHGVRPWEGFKNYRGSIPFDGRSILSNIQRSGVCLAFSSKEHQNSGIMSNRLFEGFAAGAAVIANPHPIVDKYFSDCVYVVDDTKPADVVAHEVLEIMLGIRGDPSEARRRASIGQARLEKDFSLERSLEHLFSLRGRRDTFKGIDESSSNPVIDVLVVYDGVDVAQLQRTLAEIEKQKGVTTNVAVVCDRGFADGVASALAAKWTSSRQLRFVTGELYAKRPAVDSPLRRIGSLGHLLASALKGVVAPTFCIITSSETWFEDHLKSLSKALESESSALMALSGVILETQDPARTWRRTIAELVCGEPARILSGLPICGGPGRFLFKAEVLLRMPLSLLDCLDGIEDRALCLWAYCGGPIAQTARASYVYRAQSAPSKFRQVPEDLQIKMLLDSVRNNAEWRKLQGNLSSSSASVARPPVALEIGRQYFMRIDGNGCALMSSGFAQPEPEHTWIDGYEGVIRFKLSDTHLLSHQLLVLTVFARDARETSEQQICTITLNDEVIVEDLPLGQSKQDVRIAFGEHRTLAAGDQVTLVIKMRHAEKVYDQSGRLTDPRRLGIGLTCIQVKKLNRPANAPILTASNELKFVTDGSGENCIVSGFALEHDLCWLDGTNGRLKFRIREGAIDDKALALLVAARPCEDEQTQSCSISINGQLVAEHLEVRTTPHWLKIPLPDRGILRSNSVNYLDVRVTGYANQVVDTRGNLVDSRYLGMRVDGVRLEPVVAPSKFRAIEDRWMKDRAARVFSGKARTWLRRVIARGS